MLFPHILFKSFLFLCVRVKFLRIPPSKKQFSLKSWWRTKTELKEEWILDLPLLAGQKIGLQIYAHNVTYMLAVQLAKSLPTS